MCVWHLSDNEKKTSLLLYLSLSRARVDLFMCVSFHLFENSFLIFGCVPVPGSIFMRTRVYCVVTLCLVAGTALAEVGEHE